GRPECCTTSPECLSRRGGTWCGSCRSPYGPPWRRRTGLPKVRQPYGGDWSVSNRAGLRYNPDTATEARRSRQSQAATMETRGRAMALSLTFPRADGRLAPYTLTGRPPVVPPPGPIRSRIAYAAVHVGADPLADITPPLETRLDWEATLAYRRYLWSS